MASSLRAAAVTVLALVLASLHECSPQSDRPTLSLNGGSYGLTGGPTLIPPAPTNRPGSLYDGGASYGLGGQGVRPGGGYGGGGGFNGPPGGGGFSRPPGGGFKLGQEGAGSGRRFPTGGGRRWRRRVRPSTGGGRGRRRLQYKR
ncbi:Hypothetical predicted protein [Cloeon dipterum]|uniref:Uncharacterized protein n=1 Tax=Cloeon dipterum TaxID=197152 RepID=A0A8S1E3B1_9INSE|nr:Hypothetical predicted protein [Cloeon dipterum]